MTGYRSGRIPVFAGPSLAGVTLAAPFERLPPAGAGDLLRLLHAPPCTVVLIDGVFDFRPAVWHKEVLVLMARGFRVIGAASMGALRAAELHGFGMIGVGHIFAAYASDRITADDEVAVLHAPAEIGGAPLTLAQIDVRATLQAAARARVLSVAAARALRAASAAIHYRERDWAAVLAAGAELDLGGLADWLPGFAVDLKARDARAALAVAVALAPVAPEPGREPPHTCFLLDLADAVGVKL